jgi:uridine monophosphate synthetase
MGFFSQLERRAREVDSLLCIGLDPQPEDLAAPTAQAARDFCLRLIESCAGVALAFKPNAAFFEAFGAPGVVVLQEVISAVPEGIPVILDAKRGDIASTAEAYARAAFQSYKANALTVNPYLGRDALEPFLKDAQRGVFLLCKTSNPGAADFQDLMVSPPGGVTLYENVARLAQIWNTNDNLGLVVGATHPEALRRVRAWAPELWILAPGVGAQGGDLQAALRAGLRPGGMGLLIPVSRAIARAPDPGRAAEELCRMINLERQTVASAKISPPVEAGRSHFSAGDLADGLLAAGCVQFGQFTLKSGLLSPVYIDLRRLAGYPALLRQVGQAYAALLSGLSFDRLAGLPYAALPIATAISLQGGWPLIYPRKEAKSYGTQAEIEGIFQPGERVVVIDDLTTTGGSKFEAIDKLLAAGLQVKDVVVLIDRESGAAESLAQAGYRLHAVLSLTWLLSYWEEKGKITVEQAEAVRRFIQST